MAIPSSRSEVIASLKRLGVTPRKSRGQNFLIDSLSKEALLHFFAPREDELVLEIGPGLGTMTQGLLQRCERLIVVEKEEHFCRHLEKELPAIERIIHDDIRNIDLSTFGLVSVYGNIPYSLSTDIILWTLEHRAHVKRACYLMQTEFARRVAAEPGSKDYGSLSVFCSTYASAKLGEVIGGNAFFPEPKVSSTPVLLECYREPRIHIDAPDQFEAFVRAAFATRRKTLLNNLAARYPELTKETLLERILSCGLKSDIRAERLSLEDFARLFAAF